MFELPGRNKTLPDASGLPPPTQQQIDFYDKNRQKILRNVMMSSLQTHPEDVLHGGQSLNMLLPSKRPTNDWDIFSPTERHRARTLEGTIDRVVGADIVQTNFVSIPKVFTTQVRPTSKNVYRIRSHHVSQGDDYDIDVADRPKNLETTRRGNITYESLQSQYDRAKWSATYQPLRMQKASADAARIRPHLPGEKRRYTPTPPSAPTPVETRAPRKSRQPKPFRVTGSLLPEKTSLLSGRTSLLKGRVKLIGR